MDGDDIGLRAYAEHDVPDRHVRDVADVRPPLGEADRHHEGRLREPRAVADRPQWPDRGLQLRNDRIGELRIAEYPGVRNSAFMEI